MAIRLDAARERVDYALKFGNDAACKKFNIQPSSLKRYQQFLGLDHISRSEYRIIFEKSAPKRWTDYPRLHGDWLLLNDFHLPFIDIELLEKAIRIADILNINQLGIIGDLIDFESVSRFDFGGDQYELIDELEIAQEYLAALAKRFDKILAIRGNHEERIIKFLKRIKRLFLKSTSDNEYAAYHKVLGVDISLSPWQQYKNFFENSRVEVSNYPMALFCDKYLGVHPSAYSRNPPQVEKALAHRYHKHIIGTHGHLTALGFDMSGDHITIQFGGLVDSDRVFYRGMRVTTHPEWVPAFGWIKNGKLGYYIDHPDLMDIFDYMKLTPK